VINELYCGNPFTEFVELGKACPVGVDNDNELLTGYSLTLLSLGELQEVRLFYDLSGKKLTENERFFHFLLGASEVPKTSGFLADAAFLEQGDGNILPHD
jgi:hypothetical protein